MKSKDEELKQIFLAEAFDNFEELNRLFAELEKKHHDKRLVEAIFRITHTLKANAAAMGFDAIAELSHLLEDIFSEIKNNKLELNTGLFNDLFKANDKLGELLRSIKTGETVRYKGLSTRLQVILDKARGTAHVPEAQPSAVEDLASLNAAIRENHAVETPVEDFALPEEEEGSGPQKITFSDLVQVPVDKLDNLLNLVGELAIEKDRIITQHKNRGGSNEYARLYRITSDLQYSVMGIRLVQVNVLFHKFYRIVRDVAALEDKKVNLVLEGADIEIDRNILQIISDSMIHLVRNAVSHGIEPVEERRKAGKLEAGTIKLAARNHKDHVIIEVSDDGKGIHVPTIRRKIVEKGLVSQSAAAQLSNDEVIRFIFSAGFSSADQVTQVSGRGVGMDVVKRALDSIGGKIHTQTKVGEGTTFSMLLPSSMAVKSALLFELGEAEFAIPLSFTEAVISVRKPELHKVGNGLVCSYLDRNVSVVFLHDLFEVRQVKDLRNKGQFHRKFDALHPEARLNIILVAINDQLLGLVVDRLLQQKEIIEKPLSKPTENSYFISGATILGNGNVCLVLDVPSIFNVLFGKLVPGEANPDEQASTVNMY
jgi:two-component system chemotaxis sensor kinase CheA